MQLITWHFAYFFLVYFENVSYNKNFLWPPVKGQKFHDHFKVKDFSWLVQILLIPHPPKLISLHVMTLQGAWVWRVKSAPTVDFKAIFPTSWESYVGEVTRSLPLGPGSPLSPFSPSWQSGLINSPGAPFMPGWPSLPGRPCQYKRKKQS